MPSNSSQKIRGEVTRETIIEVAEGFWAEHGIHNTSLRQISTAAGLSNPSSVQYHFGGRDGLLKAVFEYRLPVLDQRRGALLAKAERRDKDTDLRTLVDCIYRPVVDTVDARGRHAYAAFLRQVLLFEPATMVRVRMTEVSPVSWRIVRMVRERLSRHLPHEVVEHRLLACTLTVLSVIVRQDSNSSGLPTEAAYIDALDMAVAGLEQPLRVQVRTALQAHSAAPSTSATPGI